MTLDKLWLKADRYEHDTERWLRSQAKIYALRQNLGMAATFERCAEEVKGMRDAERKLAELQEVVRWERGFDEMLTWLVQTGRYPKDTAGREALFAERECARAAVDALVGEG
jgi:hypothetical protein